MTRPQRRSFICGTRARVSDITDVKLISITLSQFSSVMRSIGSGMFVPALLTRMSMRQWSRLFRIERRLLRGHGCPSMRPAGFCLLLALVGGCTPTASLRPMSWLDRLQGPSGPDVVVMVVAVIEQPAGDRYLNEELRASADEQIVPLDHRSILE